MTKSDIALMAHLLRRAGFGATRDELEAYVAKGYDAVVEELLNPGDLEPADDYIAIRYRPSIVRPGSQHPEGNVWWMHHLVNTKRPLEEKMTLFWHHLFATGESKIGYFHEMQAQITMFRQHALGNYRDLLLELAKNPAMVYWLDQPENHKTAVNENWGRELLELFSMGVGNYTETDVREASRAFTGWTILPYIPAIPYGIGMWSFEYKPQDHDDGVKTFLGQMGRFNGEDIIDIIVRQPATARFLGRYLYGFFVADEPPVPTWQTTPPHDEATIQLLAKVLTESKYEMRPVLRALFHCDAFKNARFKRVKSPVELVVGTLRQVGGCDFPSPHDERWALHPSYMGQDILNPPSVEGWHTGKEWINSGSLMKRVNFVSEMVGNITKPGVKAIIERLRAQGTLTPEVFVDHCLDLMGPLEVAPQTREQLVEHARTGGMVRWQSRREAEASARRVGEMLQLIGGTREYQLA